VPAPATLSAIHVTTQSSGVGAGATYTVQLSGGTSGTFQITDGSTGSGNYTYTPDGTTAHLRLDYTAGASPGDFDDMTLIFTTPPGGGPNNFTGNQQVTGQPYTFTGTFSYTP